ncbi:Sulfurtransferase TusE [Austwickia sp. TVS 96-490-7B]|uniref:TusE/DsrC/DsvC family sulfur relay protein n=1 Tax=Austwickia sp. TVS 96-490-7B TaxID=2830843 RepID=UPI001C55CCA3|nr:TusE/DsrC/DsvC family sulfur relay protein [Austwickia sp. TVS 96-490-7B]MBW3085234.1 Sulfurtransferase TusE [Austwickia sp. TVS 96-490-7B]
MPTTTVGGRTVAINDEGFMTDPSQWDETLGAELARLINVEMTERHWQAIRFLRGDHAARGETPTLRRVATESGIPTKELFELFPGKPAKKMAYVAGLPKPKGCV